MKPIKKKTRVAKLGKSPTFASVAVLLIEAESEIIKVWEDRVREQIPLADEHSSQIIKNSLPDFIVGLAGVLSSSGEARGHVKAICQEHGEQRAEKTFYSAEQLVHEYRLLREVIFEIMERKSGLDSSSRHIINVGVDQGIAESVIGFVRRMGEEQVATERKLFESEERFSLALRAGKIGVWELNLKAPRIQCTPRQFKIFDIDPAEGEISFALFQERLHPHDRQLMTKEISESAQEKRDFLLEHRVVWHDGSVHWVKTSGRPYYDDFGDPDRMLGTSIDITASKAEQDQRHDLIASLTREQEMRERFVNALTHDLRTPLTAAKMNGQLVARMASRPDDVVRLAARVVDNLNRADEMISDLLDASRVRAGLPLALNIEECEIRSLLTTTLEELTIIHGNRFVLEGEGEVAGHWDFKGIRRIIENLCTNAVKYGESYSAIHVNYRRDEEGLVISVRNRGDELSAEEQETLFNLFERTERARSQGLKGWGIGLTVVKGMAESHGGSVAVSCDATGTKFSIRLPMDSRPFQV
jgi:signal transduction histidine kinase